MERRGWPPETTPARQKKSVMGLVRAPGFWQICRMRMFSLLICLVFAGPVLAQSSMSAAEFETYVTGRTLTYAEHGVVYGTEEYLTKRRVRWAFSKEECRDGYWYEAGSEICFVYEGNPAPQCWTFTRGPGGLIARFMNVADGREVYEARHADTPLGCPGPKVGV